VSVNNIYFFTGFPGFIATRLIRHIMMGQETACFELLVHPSQMEKARGEVERLEQSGKGRSGRFSLIAGDITAEGLAMPNAKREELAETVTHVFHLAAIYDLAVPQEAAYKVNVIGTRQVNAWVQTLRRLQRYVYFSTAYVSGERTGMILEEELDCGQTFKNHYESTKFEAEVHVRDVRGIVPTTIIRPGIVMGDSRTGETAKFDGPYFVMRFLDRFAKLPIPYIGRSVSLFNLVPVDYIVEATVHLAHAEAGAGRTYHLTDPHPHAARDVYRAICCELIGKEPALTLPAGLVYGSLCVPAFRRFVGVEKETIAYFRNHAVYDSTQAQRDLAEAGIACPDLLSYIGQAVSYYKAHRDDPEKSIPVR